MVLIRIDRDSIKKNPNAGSCVTYLELGRDMNFEIDSKLELPKWLKDYIITEEFAGITRKTVANGYIAYTGRIDDSSIIDQFYEWAKENADKGYTIRSSVNFHRQQIFHLPEPKWLYSYEQIPIVCEICNASNTFDELGENEGGDICCGKCDASVDIDLEEIDHVVNEMGLK